MFGLLAAAATSAMSLFVKGAIAGAVVYGGVKLIDSKE